MPDKDQSALSTCYQLLRSCIFRSLSLYDCGDVFVIGLWEVAVDPNMQDMEINPPFSIRIRAVMQSQRNVWEEFLHLIDWHRVGTIHIGDLWTIEPHNWRRLLLVSHQLNNLSMKGNLALTVAELLRKTDECNTSSRFLVSKLRMIHLSNARL